MDAKEWYARGQKAGPAATKYRKGACQNCGAATHKTLDCVERPRKLGAKWTGKGIVADEVVHKVDLSYDGKRDRWNGYDPTEYKQIMDEWELIESERREMKEKQLEKSVAEKRIPQSSVGEKSALDELSDSDGEAGEHGDKYVDEVDMPGQKVDAQSRTTVRNLRIREDTAKYLRNLDPNSAYYDPKTRSMRENPLQGREVVDSTFVGDNVHRWTGESSHMVKEQVFAWQASDRGVDINMQAEPTRTSMLHREYSKQKEVVRGRIREDLVDKYGGGEYLHKEPTLRALDQSELYVEYSRAGKVIKGAEKAKKKSKYVEDDVAKFAGGHASVWGSFFDTVTKQWGYVCCRAPLRYAYCTGNAGVLAAACRPTVDTSAPPEKSLTDLHVEKLMNEAKKRRIETK